jgi:tRNA(Arg) A34 adenosine deaminase TadA
MDDQKVVGKKVVYGKSNFKKQHNTPSTHAEIDAFKKLSRYYASRDMNIIVVRFTKTGDLCSSRPCYHCLKTLMNSGMKIKHVYYSCRRTMYKEKFNTMFESELTTITSGMRNAKSMKKQ